MNATATAAEQQRRAAWKILEKVKDPEIPVIDIVELGIARDVAIHGEIVEVTITPTYSGCPAMHTIEQDIRDMLGQAGFTRVRVNTVLSPAWTTDWMTETARRKLRDYGIAPPQLPPDGATAVVEFVPRCPRCNAPGARRISEFGSTACKALYQCRECLEPFDYFKRL